MIKTHTMLEDQCTAIEAAMKRIKHAVGKDDGRGWVQYIRVERNGNHDSMIATDGHRLVCLHLDFEAEHSPASIHPTTDPRDPLSWRADAYWPDWQHLLPRSNFAVRVVRRALITAVSEVKQVFDGYNRERRAQHRQAIKACTTRADRSNLQKAGPQEAAWVPVQFDADRMSVRFANIGREVEVDGPDVLGEKMGINPKYLLEALRAMKGKLVTLAYTDPRSPLKITGDDGFELVMPCRM